MDARGAVWLNGPPRLFRQPVADPRAYKTFALLRPRKTHFRPATCAEYECDEHKQGFVLTVDTGTELGQRQYHYVTHDKSRSYSMQRVGPTLCKFVYGPGQEGFGHRHMIPLWRPPRALVFGGDWRAQTTDTRVHQRLDDWVDESLNHHDKIATIQKRG